MSIISFNLENYYYRQLGRIKEQFNRYYTLHILSIIIHLVQTLDRYMDHEEI